MTSPPHATETSRPITSQLLEQSDNGEATALPQWAQAFFLLGDTIVRWDDERARIVAGLALPTRAYAALMIAGLSNTNAVRLDKGGA